MEEEKMRRVVGRPAGRAQEAPAPTLPGPRSEQQGPFGICCPSTLIPARWQLPKTSRLRLGCSILWYGTREAPWAQKPGELSQCRAIERWGMLVS